MPSIPFAMNSTICSATGYTLAFLTFWRELCTPDNVQRDIRAFIEKVPFVPQIISYLKTFANVLAEVK